MKVVKIQGTITACVIHSYIIPLLKSYCTGGKLESTYCLRWRKCKSWKCTAPGSSILVGFFSKADSKFFPTDLDDSRLQLRMVPNVKPSKSGWHLQEHLWLPVVIYFIFPDAFVFLSLFPDVWSGPYSEWPSVSIDSKPPRPGRTVGPRPHTFTRCVVPILNPCRLPLC